MKNAFKLNRLLFLYLVTVLFTSGCSSVRLISNYDEITDTKINALQENFTKFFVALQDNIGTDAADYAHYKSYYRDTKAELNTLKIRASAIDNNKNVQDQIKELTGMFENLEELHRIGFQNTDQLKLLEQPFNTAFTAMIKLQMALRRGK